MGPKCQPPAGPVPGAERRGGGGGGQMRQKRNDAHDTLIVWAYVARGNLCPKNCHPRPSDFEPLLVLRQVPSPPPPGPPGNRLS